MNIETPHAVFFAKDEEQAKIYAKSQDMAFFIHELVYNGWREFKHTDYDYQKAWDKIHELLEQYHIVIDDLTS